MLTAGEFCNRRVITIGKTDTVIEAARRMRTSHVGCLVVVDESDGFSKPVGIVTDRDIVVGVVASASTYLQTLQVGDILSDPLVTARDQDSLIEVLRTMRTRGVRRMPIVNSAGNLTGLIAFDDLLEFFSDELSELTALMSREQRREAETRI